MAHTAEAISNEKQQRVCHKLSNQTQIVSRKSPALNCNQNSAVDHALKQTFKPSSLHLTVDQIDADHFTELVGLALELNLADSVEKLLATKGKADLKPFLDGLISAIERAVTSNIERYRETIVASCIELFRLNNVALEEDAFKHLFNAITQYELGTLEIGITGEENHNFDNSESLTLNISSCCPEMIKVDVPDHQLAQSAIRVIKDNTADALILGSNACHYYYIHTYYQVYCYAEEMFDNRCTDIELIFNEVVNNGGLQEIECDSEDELEAKEEITNTIIDMVRLYADEVEAGDTFLSEWFSIQFTPVNYDALDDQSHNRPIHILITNDDLEPQYNESGEAIFEEADSRIHLEPSLAIDTLTAIAKNRTLIHIFDALTSLGSQFNDAFMVRHNIQPSQSPFV